MLNDIIVLLLSVGIICLGFSVLGMIAKIVEYGMGIGDDDD